MTIYQFISNVSQPYPTLQDVTNFQERVEQENARFTGTEQVVDFVANIFSYIGAACCCKDQNAVEVKSPIVTQMELRFSKSMEFISLPPLMIPVQEPVPIDFVFSKEKAIEICRTLSDKISKADQENDLEFLNVFVGEFNSAFSLIYPDCSLNKVFPKYSPGTLRHLAIHLLAYMEEEATSENIMLFFSFIKDALAEGSFPEHYEEICKECVELTALLCRSGEFNRFLELFSQIYPSLEIKEVLQNSDWNLLFSSRKLLCNFIVEKYPPREVLFRIEMINFFEKMDWIRMDCEDASLDLQLAVNSRRIPAEPVLRNFYQFVGDYLPLFPIQELIIELSQEEQYELSIYIIKWMGRFNRIGCQEKLERYSFEGKATRTAQFRSI